MALKSDYSSEGKLALVRERILPCVFVLLLVVSIIPIIWVGKYAHPCLDDFSYGAHTATALREGESLLAAVLYTVKRYYFGWQGTFSATVVMSLVPSIWGEDYYALTPIIMLLVLFFGTYKLMDTLVRRVIGGSHGNVITISSILLLFSVQQLPNATESFYWWNGAAYYTFTYSFFLLFIDRLIVLGVEKNKRWKIGVQCMLLAVFLGGNNFVTGLLTAEICVLCFIFCCLNRKILCKWVAAITVIMLFCFAINVFAPGNAVRQAGYETMSPVSAVYHAVKQAFCDIPAYTSLELLAVLLLLAPCLRKLTEKTNWTFAFPLAVQCILILLYASQNTPHFFAIGTSGPGRLRNIVYFSYLWFLLFSEFYWIGYMSKRFQFRLSGKKQLIALTIVLVVFCVGVVKGNSYNSYTSFVATEVLQDGSAEQFDREVDLRMEQFFNEQYHHVRVEPLSNYPKLLFWVENNVDVNEWANIAAKNYYGKESVCLVQPEK